MGIPSDLYDSWCTLSQRSSYYNHNPSKEDQTQRTNQQAVNAAISREALTASLQVHALLGPHSNRSALTEVYRSWALTPNWRLVKGEELKQEQTDMSLIYSVGSLSATADISRKKICFIGICSKFSIFGDEGLLRHGSLTPETIFKDHPGVDLNDDLNCLSCVICLDDTRILFSLESGYYGTYDFSTQESKLAAIKHRTGVKRVLFKEEGESNHYVTVSRDGEVHMNMVDGSRSYRVGVECPLEFVDGDMHRNGINLALCDTHRLYFYDVTNLGEPPKKVDVIHQDYSDNRIVSVRFSPNARLLLVETLHSLLTYDLQGDNVSVVCRAKETRFDFDPLGRYLFVSETHLYSTQVVCYEYSDTTGWCSLGYNDVRTNFGITGVEKLCAMSRNGRSSLQVVSTSGVYTVLYLQSA